MRKGNALYEIGRYEEAIGCYEQVLRLNPNHSLARFQLSMNRDLLESSNKSASYYPKSSSLFGVMNDAVFSSQLFAWYGTGSLSNKNANVLADAEILGDVISYDRIWILRGSCLDSML
jgi:tetratricopeptide (TPR) repeat protein